MMSLLLALISPLCAVTAQVNTQWDPQDITNTIQTAFGRVLTEAELCQFGVPGSEALCGDFGSNVNRPEFAELYAVIARQDTLQGQWQQQRQPRLPQQQEQQQQEQQQQEQPQQEQQQQPPPQQEQQQPQPPQQQPRDPIKNLLDFAKLDVGGGNSQQNVAVIRKPSRRSPKPIVGPRQWLGGQEPRQGGEGGQQPRPLWQGRGQQRPRPPRQGGGQTRPSSTRPQRQT